MIDREAFVSRLILEADSELERGAAYWLQVDGLELARLRAIVRDLAACPEPYNIEWAECQLCESERLIDGQGDMTTLHTPGCPWLRATQEVTP